MANPERGEDYREKAQKCGKYKESCMSKVRRAFFNPPARPARLYILASAAARGGVANNNRSSKNHNNNNNKRHTTPPTTTATVTAAATYRNHNQNKTT